MSRLVAVSNRISVPKRGAVPGGLAVGLLAAMQARRGMWFGWDGETAEVAADEPAVVRKDGVTFASIDMDQAEFRDFYLGFCNGTLWPLFHYFVDAFRYNDTHYEAYQRMNQRYARLLMPLLEPDDLVWVHDYHLFPLAQRLREAGAGNPWDCSCTFPSRTSKCCVCCRCTANCCRPCWPTTYSASRRRRIATPSAARPRSCGAHRCSRRPTA